MKPVESDRLDAEERRELSSSDFGIPEDILEKAAEYGVRVESPVVLSWAGK